MHLRATILCSSSPFKRGNLPRSPRRFPLCAQAARQEKKTSIPFGSTASTITVCFKMPGLVGIFRHQSEMRKWRKQIKTKSVRSFCTNLDMDNLRHKCARVLVASSIRHWNPCKVYYFESEKPSPLRLKKPRDRLHVMVNENNKWKLVKYWDQNLST